MTRTRRRALGALGLALSVGPWLATAAVSLHVLVESGHLADHAQRDLEGPLHGHGHDPATPEHQHVMIVPAPPPVAARTSHTVVASASLPPLLPASPARVTGPAAREQYGGLGPPPRAQSIVILRI